MIKKIRTAIANRYRKISHKSVDKGRARQQKMLDFFKKVGLPAHYELLAQHFDERVVFMKEAVDALSDLIGGSISLKEYLGKCGEMDFSPLTPDTIFVAPSDEEDLPTEDEVFSKITDKLKEQKNPPKNLFMLGWWLGFNLTPAELETLDRLEKRVGEEEANRRMTKAMVASGTFVTDDNEHVQSVHQVWN